MQQHPVIVVQAEKQAGFRGHGRDPVEPRGGVNRTMLMNCLARLCLSMILSENQFPLFGIMLQRCAPATIWGAISW
jgi:hypothetical protein